MKVVYTHEAVQDLTRLRSFIAEKNPIAAQRIAKDLLRNIDILKKSPSIGVEVKKASNPKIVRDLISGSYIIRYLLLNETVSILRIWHHKKNKNSEVFP